jgi:ankyrin repeat protein
MLAAHHGNISVVKFLIASDADLTATDKVRQKIPNILAAARINTFHISHPTPQFGKTAIIHAANSGHSQIVELLAQYSTETITSPCKVSLARTPV